MPGSYFYPLHRVFLNLSGGTVTGDTIFTQGVRATYLSGDTIYSGGTELGNVISGMISTGLLNFLPLSGGTGGPYYFTGNTTASTIAIDTQLEPTIDNNVDIGIPLKRFRSLNTVNGVAVNFTAETRIVTPKIELGSVVITDSNIVLTGNTLDGGSW